ncbi:MAG: hypothetical protein H6717_41795 [Polyangiaceae bacterium]|nr:hypothetical protein [Polyangiaceae bacterium]
MRHYLVEDVVPPPDEGQATLVRLVCLDDDNQGRRLEVLWELELGARVLEPEVHGLGKPQHFDPPRHFSAYLHAVKWNSVTATDARLFQAPLRAGIQIMNHQLTPLKKALALPRANLFIADDVGVGKTIEAGLVLQELLLRHQVAWSLIVCPASVALQWRDEMEKRFGLHFEIYNRAFVARRHQERGFAVNPWSTHTRFIISYPLLRRPEYRDPLLQHLGERVKKSLLILDEAHTAAPATASKYAVDSRITRVIRDVAPRFENRLFLSATPHNGHSNSFSALLELLDPQRFTRGVPISGPDQLDAVMVRRLKEDLRQIDSGTYPRRRVVRLDLSYEGAGDGEGFGTWHALAAGDGERAGPTKEIGQSTDAELVLSDLLAKYTKLQKPKRGRAKLVLINLQKRLLSSVEAFYRTLRRHAETAEAQLEGAAKRESAQADLFAAAESPEPPSANGSDDDEYGADDDAEDEAEAEAAARHTEALPKPSAEALELLRRMLSLAEQNRSAPDAKVLALLDWMREHQCSAMGAPHDERKGAKWSDTRVIIFTEYGDTKRYLLNLLTAACEGTPRGDERVVQLHGGMSDESREAVQRAFLAPPGEHPARILIATDAAREGINLQAHCADLFHFDIPWNPARMEQRNGRIDRALQPAPEVRCHYFVYTQRHEDRVLDTLVHKVAVIQRELGSLSAVVMDRLGDTLGDGIQEGSADAIERAGADSAAEVTTKRELEAMRSDESALRLDNEDNGKALNRSRDQLEFRPELLRDALDVGCTLSGSGPLQAAPDAPAHTSGGKPLAVFRVPTLSASWAPTLDSLRPPRERDEAFWEWRKREPLPVVFAPTDRMTSELGQLHLEHPFVKRVLSRFLAQGYSAHDLSRVTIVRNDQDSLVRVIAFGRLSLFGPGAARLHDQLVSVAAQWRDTETSDRLKPFADKADRRALEQLESLLAESPSLEGVSESVQHKLLARAADDFRALFKHVQAEADAVEHDARQKLAARAAVESEALRKILKAQRERIEKTIQENRQQALQFSDTEREQREQFEQDRKHMEARLDRIAKEIETEPREIETLYQIEARRVEPVGLVYLWPTTR